MTNTYNTGEGTNIGEKSQQSLRDSVDVVRTTGENMKDDLRELGQNAKQAAQAKLDTVRQTASEQYGTARELATNTMRDVQERANRQAVQLEERIVEKPLQSVLIASGVGFILGLILVRR